MKRVLVVHYSQSGQLNDVARSFTQPLVEAPHVEVVFEAIEPERPFPFPWPFFEFLNAFPESVYEDPPQMKPLSVTPDDPFDLVILAYQVWFLSPALPMTGFLQTETARALLRDKPVITLIACRNMWLTAQEKMKRRLQELGARLIDNVVLTDAAGGFASFISTPTWVLTGNKGPYLGFIPAAGVAPDEIARASRFGVSIARHLEAEEFKPTGPLLRGLGAVAIDEKLIASEKIGHRSFRIWGKLLRALGPPETPARRPVLALYAVFLISMILTVVPISALIKVLISPFTQERIRRQKDYFAQPSGDQTFGMELPS